MPPQWTPPCSTRSLELEEPLVGTAPPERRWLVLEQPGTWGHDALREASLAPEIAEALAERTSALGIRMQMVRRTLGRDDRAARTVLLACLEPGNRWIEQVAVEEPAGLLALDLDRFAAGEPTGAGVLLDGPVWLACTHGTKDPCCAKKGMPVGQALRRAVGERYWHSSHLGGDRFAANVAVLPLGLVLGRVPVEAVAEIVAGVEAGHLPLDHLRGRGGWPKAVQTAELAVRRRHGLTGIDDVTVEEDGGDWVRFGREGGSSVVRLVHQPTATLRHVSCKAAEATDPGMFSVLEVSDTDAVSA